MLLLEPITKKSFLLKPSLSIVKYLIDYFILRLQVSVARSCCVLYMWKEKWCCLFNKHLNRYVTTLIQKPFTTVAIKAPWKWHCHPCPTSRVNEMYKPRHQDLLKVMSQLVIQTANELEWRTVLRLSALQLAHAWITYLNRCCQCCNIFTCLRSNVQEKLETKTSWCHTDIPF